MNSTTKDFEEFERRLDEKIRLQPTWFTTLKNNAAQKLQNEISLIERHASACPVYREGDFRLNIGDLDDMALGNMLGSNFYNVEVMRGVSCAVDSMFYSIPSEQGVVSMAEMIRQRITDLKVVASGVQGQFSVGAIHDIDGFIGMKTALKGNDMDLGHELFIGLLGTNQLRKDIPNFAYIYGGFFCPPPEIDPVTKKFINLCSGGGGVNVPYLLMENISPKATPAINGAKYIRSASLSQALSLMYQFLFAIEHANRMIKFTHYDAHNENLLMRDISGAGFGREYLIPYTMANGVTYYVRADRVATLIDYGMAGIQYKDVYYGTPDVSRTRSSQFNDSDWPLYDAYKMVMFCLMDAVEAKNMPVIEAMVKIFRFFNKTEDPIKLVGINSPQWRHRYSLPRTPETSKYTLIDLISFMMRTFPDVNVVFEKAPSNLKVLQCTACQTLNAIARVAGADQKTIPHPKTFFYFYDAAAMVSRLHPNRYQEMVKAFDYVGAKRTFVDKLKSLEIEAERLKIGAYKVDLQPELIFNQRTLANIQSSHVTIMTMIRVLEDIALNIRVGTWMAEKFDDLDLKRILNASSEKMDGYQPLICELSNSASNNYNIIYDAMMTPEGKRLTERKSPYNWYATTAGNIVALQNKACFSPILSQKITLTNPVIMKSKKSAKMSSQIPPSVSFAASSSSYSDAGYMRDEDILGPYDDMETYTNLSRTRPDQSSRSLALPEYFSQDVGDLSAYYGLPQ